MAGSNRVATGIFASRVVGLLREVILGAVIGTTPAADAFRIAMRVPNMLQNLLGEGSISAAFVPVYAGLIEERRETDANKLARQMLGFFAAIVPLLVALVILFARPLVWLTTLGAVTGPRFDLAVSLTRFTALGVGFLVLSAWCLGILNAHRRYLLSYSAPVLWSLAQIIALLAALIFDTSLEQAARWGAIGMVIGSIAQFAIQLPAVMKISGAKRPAFNVGPDLMTVLRRFGPAVGGRGVVQLSSFVDLALASMLVAGAPAILGLVAPLYLLSISVFGFSVAVSELTEMSRSGGGDAAVAARVRLAMRRVLLPSGLVTAGAVGAGAIIVGTLYQRLAELLGRDGFTSASTAVAAATLAAFGLGLPAAMTARVTQNALYAMGDVKGPARIAVARLVVGGTLGYLFMLQFDHLAMSADGTLGILPSGLESTASRFSTITVDSFPHWPPWERLPSADREASPYVHFGPVGLGLGAAAASWVEWVLLRRRLRTRLHDSISTGLGVWIALAGAAAFVAARLVALADLPSPLDLLVVGAVIASVYMGALYFVGIRPRRTD